MAAVGERGAALDRRGVVAVLFCCLVAMLDGADTQALAIAAPVIARDLSMGTASVGLLFSAALMGAAIGATAAGTLADRFGTKRLLVLCTLAFGVLQFATAYVERFETMLLVRMLAGLGLGGATPCFLSLAAAHSPAAVRARVLGIVWAFFPVGGLIGGLANGWIIEQGSWRYAFMVGGAIPVIVALLLALAVRETPSFAPAPGGILGLLARDRLLRGRALLLCAVFFGTFAILAGVVVWMPWVMASHGFGPAQGGIALAWHAVGALLSIAAGGFLIERFGPLLVAGGLLLGAALLVLLALSLDDFGSIVVLMLLLGVVLGLAASGAIALGGLLYPANVRSGGLGLAMAAGRVGQMVLPYASGLAMAHGLSGAGMLLASPILPLLTAAAAWRLSRSLGPELHQAKRCLPRSADAGSA